MTTATIRPNATISSFRSTAVGSATLHGAAGDNSDASYISMTAGAGEADVVLGFGTITPVAGSVYKSIQLHMRYRGANGLPFVSGAWMTAPEAPWYGLEVNNGGLPPSSTTVWQTDSSVVLTTPISQSDIDALQVYVFQYHASYFTDIADVWATVVYAAPPSAPSTILPSGTITTRKPTIQWTHNAGSDGGAQTKFRVRIFSAAQYGIGGFDPATSPATQDSGIVTSSGASWLLTTNLANGVGYRAYVQTFATTNGVDQPSPWGTGPNFTVTIGLSAPTALVPTNGSTATTSKPALGASIAAQSDGILVKREWNVASNNTFVTNLQTFADATFAATKSGSITFPAAWSRLAQGIWYARVRTVDEHGITSAWSATNTFTVAHVPSTGGWSPTAGVSVNYGAGTTVLSWNFSDPDPEDFQESREVEFWLASSGIGTATSSGKILSGVSSYTATIPIGWKDFEVKWRVRVYDQDDVASAWSIEQSFFPRDLPVANITAPVGVASATNSQPTVIWTFTAAGRTQSSFRVIVSNDGTGQVLADSGVVNSAALSWQVPTPVIAISTTYQIDLTLVDSTGLTGIDSDTFTATYTAPTTPTFTVQEWDFQGQGRTIIDWSSASQSGTCLGWNIYRRLLGETTWVLVHAETDPNANSYVDYLAPANTDIEYAVSQVAESLGDPVESAYAVQAFNGYSDHYMLVVPDNPLLNLTLYHVTADSSADEHEIAEINLIGRGRQVSYGTRFGQRGSLSGTFMDRVEMTAKTQRLYLEAIRNAGLKTYLKSPFGDVWAVALSSASISRIAGIGLRAHSAYTLEYVEVTA